MSARRELAGAIAAAAELTEAEQLEMLPTRFAPGDATGRDVQVRDAVRRDRAGRPAGARNLATRQALDFVRRVLGDPMIERARMAMHTPESLALELGCDKLEAARFIDGIRADLMRLFYAPVAPVTEDGKPVPFFAVTIGGASAAGDAAAPPWLYPGGPVLEAEQNQEVSGDAAGQSHAGQSHGEAK